MKLTVHFTGVSRPRQEVERLQDMFRNAMLDYSPSIEKLKLWKDRGHYEFIQSIIRGRWSVKPILSKKELDTYKVFIEIK